MPAAGAEDPIVMTITSDDQPPQVNLERVQAPKPGKSVDVTAKVWDPSGVKWVRLRYRHVTQFKDYKTGEIQYDPQTGLWSATIPGAFVVSQWDPMYFVEAMDTRGQRQDVPGYGSGDALCDPEAGSLIRGCTIWTFCDRTCGKDVTVKQCKTLATRRRGTPP